MVKKLRSQPRVKGQTRIPTGSSLIPALRKKVEEEARAHGVWVVAVILSDHFYIQTPSYREDVKRRMRLLKRA